LNGENRIFKELPTMFADEKYKSATLPGDKPGAGRLSKNPSAGSENRRLSTPAVIKSPEN
jgi:hypothetical protein